MKSFVLKLSFCFWVLILGLNQSCHKNEENTEIQKCNLTAKEILTVEDRVATLIYTNKLSSLNIPTGGYFIIDHNLSQTHLPLMACNFPKTKYPSLKIGESMKINFSGRIEVLPETVDAFSTYIELTKITKIDE